MAVFGGHASELGWLVLFSEKSQVSVRLDWFLPISETGMFRHAAMTIKSQKYITDLFAKPPVMRDQNDGAAKCRQGCFERFA